MARFQTSISLGKRVLPTLASVSRALLLSRMLALGCGMANALWLPLLLDQHSVGIFFLSQLYLSGATIAALLGLTFTAQGRVTTAMAKGDLSTARRCSIQATTLVLLISLTLAGLTAAASLLFDAALQPVIWLTAAALPCGAMGVICAELLRGYHLYRWAAYITLFMAAAPISYLLLALAFGWSVSLQGVLSGVLVGSAFAAGIGMARLSAHLGGLAERQVLRDIGGLLRATMPNLATTLTFYLLAQLDIVLLGVFATPAQVAQYGIATRLAALLILPFSIASSAFGPIAAELFAVNQLDRLQQQARLIVGLACALAALGYGIFALLGPSLITAWNADYASVYGLFLLLGFGQVIAVGFGTGGNLLMLLGHQFHVMRVTIIAGLAIAVGCTLALLLGGLVGLATASALGSASLAFLIWQQARGRLGIDLSLGALRP